MGLLMAVATLDGTKLKKVLNAGCGSDLLPHAFRDCWKEIRLDLDPKTRPDLVGDIRDMPMVGDGSMDAVVCQHTLEHVHGKDAPRVLREFRRVLRPGGLVSISVPDLLWTAQEIVAKGIDTVLYRCSAGPVAAIDMLYGFRPELATGNHYMEHKNGFTPASLTKALEAAGFTNIKTTREDPYCLVATATKPSY